MVRAYTRVVERFLVGQFIEYELRGEMFIKNASYQWNSSFVDTPKTFYEIEIVICYV